MKKERRKKLLRTALLTLLLCLAFLSTASAQAKGKLRALCVSGGPSFRYDAYYMQRALKENATNSYKVKASNYFITGSGTTNSRVSSIMDQVFSDSTSGDLNLFYFTGHGYAGVEVGDTNFSLSDVKGLVINPYRGYVYSYYDLALKLTSYKADAIAIIDSCYAQAFYLNGVRRLSASRRKKLTLLLSSSWKQESYAASGSYDTNISYYSYALLDGLGYWDDYIYLKCDTDDDGYATVREIFSYASRLIQGSRLKMTPYLYMLAGKNYRLYA